MLAWRNWKTIILAMLLISAVWMAFAIVSMPIGFMGGPPRQLVETRDLPETLKRAFAADPNLKTDFDVWQISGLPDRQCIWRINGHRDYLDQFIQEERLEKTDSNHARAQMLSKLARPSWPSRESENWEWFATPNYGKKHLEGQDLFLVARNSEESIAVVLYEWLF